MAIPVKLEVFEGPLDLLLHLIDKNKINIYDIPIVEITDQYMAYISAMEKENLDVTSEFMLMAATLLDIKCKMLLPKVVDEEGEEIDPRQELVEQLLQNKMFKHMAGELRKSEEDSVIYFKEATLPKEVEKYKQPIDLDELLGGLTLAKLNKIYEDVLSRNKDKIDPIRSKFGKIEKEEVTVADKMDYLDDYIKKHRKFSFRELLLKQRSKIQVVCSFLAVLEFIKVGKIKVIQDGIGEDIKIEAL